MKTNTAPKMPATTRKSAAKAAAAPSPKAESYKAANLRRIDQLAPRLNIPVSELTELLLSAALDGVESTLARTRKITLPLELKTDLAGMAPVYLPAEKVELLRELCAAAEIRDGAEGFVNAVLGEMIDESLQSKLKMGRNGPFGLMGVPAAIADGWTIDAAAVTAIQTVVDRWNGKGGAAWTP